MFFAVGCSVYDASLIGEGNASVPNRPASSTSSADDDVWIAFALKDIYIRQSAEMAAQTGIDLDGAMTMSPKDATCEPRTVDGAVVGQAVVDGRKGIDNSLGANLLPTVDSSLPCLEDNIALAQGRGVGTIVLWVQRWNGQPNDASVAAMLTTAVDGTSEDPSLVGFTDDDPVNLVYLNSPLDTEAPDPAWDTEDSWYLDPVDFDTDGNGEPSLDFPKVQQADGYVASGRLVIPLPEGTGFKLIAGDGSLSSDGAMTVVVDGGFLMGDIRENRTQLDHGLFAGRFTIDKLAEATPSIGMCNINATVIETLFGQFADIHKSPESDGTGVECDAFSLGITFSGVASRVAGLAASSRPRLEPCAASPVVLDRCCPSQWLEGRTRAETCDTPEKLIKAERFDALPPTVEIPVRKPQPLF